MCFDHAFTLILCNFIEITRKLQNLQLFFHDVPQRIVSTISKDAYASFAKLGCNPDRLNPSIVAK